MQSLKSSIERLAALKEMDRGAEARTTFLEFREALTQGKIRAAEKIDGRWTVHAWVKSGILLGFRLGELAESGCGALTFVDKDTFPVSAIFIGRPGAHWCPAVLLRAWERMLRLR